MHIFVSNDNIEWSTLRISVS